MKAILLLTIIYLLTYYSNAKTAQEWKSRVIYELMTDRFAKSDGDTTPCEDLQKLCGGTFKGILNNLDYIQGLGCNAIWISPVVANIEDSYHGYWTQNIYEINKNFGTEQELKDLIKTCHERDIWVMVDVIVNHVGYVKDKDFSSVVPFNDPSHYHEDISCEQIKEDDYEGLEKCWLYGLPDLSQENEFVRKTLLEWIKDFVKTYEFDGLRLDALKHVPRPFWKEFSTAAGVFTLGENFNPEVPYLASYQGPVDSLLNFPLRSTLEYTFQKGGSMNSIENYYNGASATWPDMTVLANFVSNHDLTRFLHDNDNTSGFKAAIAFCLCSVGIPTVYYGDEQGFGGGSDPGNREPLWTNMNRDNEFYKFIKKINEFRKESKFYNEEQIQRYMDDTFYTFSRGKYLFAFTNSQENQERTIEFHPYSEGTKVCNLFFPDDCVEVKEGKFLLVLNDGEVKILVPQEKQDDESNHKEPIITKEKFAASIREMGS